MVVQKGLGGQSACGKWLGIAAAASATRARQAEHAVTGQARAAGLEVGAGQGSSFVRTWVVGWIRYVPAMAGNGMRRVAGVGLSGGG
jgi:hypothetical protein